MKDPSEYPPADLDSRIEAYVAAAANKQLKVDAKRVARYARVLIAAEEVVKYRSWKSVEVPDEMLRTAAAEHGSSENDAGRALKMYSRARQDQQKLHVSAKGCATSLSRLAELLAKYYQSVPVDTAASFPLRDLLGAIDVVNRFAVATSPHPTNLAKMKMTKSELSLSKESHAFVWWWKSLPSYRGKWSDMYNLARCWHLTNAKDVGAFRLRVLNLKPKPDSEGVAWVLGCPPWALP